MLVVAPNEVVCCPNAGNDWAVGVEEGAPNTKELDADPETKKETRFRCQLLILFLQVMLNLQRDPSGTEAKHRIDRKTDLLRN